MATSKLGRTDVSPSIQTDEELAAEEKISVAPQWKLMWWKFRKHKMALISAVIIILLYTVAIFCEFIAPYDPEQFFPQYQLSPPTIVRIRDAEGNFQWPFVYQKVRSRDP